MTMQTATLDTNASLGVALPQRTLHLLLSVGAFGGLAVLAPSATGAAALAVVGSLALAATSVARVIRADRFGLADNPSFAEMLTGATLVALMLWIAQSVTAGLLGPATGFGTAMMVTGVMMAVFAAIATVETVGSALACYVMKRFAATGSIGAEVAVMLNAQQKYAISLDGLDR